MLRAGQCSARRPGCINGYDPRRNQKKKKVQDTCDHPPVRSAACPSGWRPGGAILQLSLSAPAREQWRKQELPSQIQS